MADYTSESELIEHFGSEQVLIASDRDGSGVADIGVINDAISEASDEMDSYIGVQYELPLASTPGVVKRWCCEITMYLMSAESGALTEEKRTRYDDAKAWLKDIAAGRATLNLGTDTDDAGEVEYSAESRQFTRTKLSSVL